MKDLFKRMKRQGTNWKRIFEIYISSEALVSQVHKELLDSTIKTSNN